MTVVAEALADTSAFIAVEHGQIRAADLPTPLAVSLVTVAELTVGVRTARTTEQRTERLATLHQAEMLNPFPVDKWVAGVWVDLRVALRESRRKLRSNDSWIAATALAYGLPVVTQDDVFAKIPGLEVIRL